MSKKEISMQSLLKQKVAEKAVSIVKPGMVLGVGSGSTVAYFIREIAKREDLKASIKAASTSLDTSLLLAEAGIREISLHITNEQLDLTVDGADEVSEDLFLIKG